MIFIDFDGTIVDFWKRYHDVFFYNLDNNITVKEYMIAKKLYKFDDVIAKFFNIKLANNYYEQKKILLEDINFLKSDSLLINVNQLLDFFKYNKVKILAYRRNEENFYKQLVFLGLSELRKNCIVLNPDIGLSKKVFIQTNYNNQYNTIIGDSVSELEVSDVCNTKVIIVNTGMLDIKDIQIKKNIDLYQDIKKFLCNYEEEIENVNKRNLNKEDKR